MYVLFLEFLKGYIRKKDDQGRRREYEELQKKPQAIMILMN